RSCIRHGVGERLSSNPPIRLPITPDPCQEDRHTVSVIAPNPSISFAPPQAGVRSAKPRVVVLGNEKGGSGKSTTAMHLVVALLRQGFRVGVIDLDARQGTLSRYVENRTAFAHDTGLPLPLPELR